MVNKYLLKVVNLYKNTFLLTILSSALLKIHYKLTVLNLAGKIYDSFPKSQLLRDCFIFKLKPSIIFIINAILKIYIVTFYNSEKI